MFNNIISIATFHNACFHYTCMHRKAHICFILHLHVCHYLAPAPLKICYLARHLKEVARACPTAWNCHLHQSLRFSGSSNHLIHTFLAVASLGNLCPAKLLHLGMQHSVPHLSLLRLSMPPTATHQQDNSYGGSAIWRVSKFAIPLIKDLFR